MMIEIEAETESLIVSQSILDAISYMYDDIILLAELENTQEFQSEDLENFIRDLEAMKIVYRYYTVFDQWSNLDDYTLGYINEDGEAELSDLDETLLREQEELDASLALLKMETIELTDDDALEQIMLKAEEYIKSADLPDLGIDEGSL